MPKKVNVKGPIISNDEAWIYEWFGIEAASPSSVQKQIDAAGDDDLEVVINSGGGSVFAGSEIYTMLKSHARNVTTQVVGLAASAASVIAMAGNKVVMAPTAQMMIHNVSAYGAGDYRDMEHTAGILKNANETIASAYMLKTGMEQAELLGMMDDETWLTPQQALDKGFIDEVMFQDQAPKVVASAGLAGMLPEEVITKIRNMLKDQNPNEPVAKATPSDQSDIFMRSKQLAQLNLLKLQGGTIHE